MANIQHVIDGIYKHFKNKKVGGKNADYIPELKKVNPKLYAISIFTVDGKSYNVGDYTHEFALESASKVFSLALALKKHGVDAVSKKIGTKQTNMPFNSIADIDLTKDHMLNSFENGGAMATTSLSYDKNKKKFEEKIFENMSKFAGRKLTYSQSVYKSEITNSDHNRAIAYLLKSYDKFYGDVEDTLDVYTRQCSALVTSKDVAIMAATLANRGVNPKTGEKVIDSKFLPYILAHMSANGLYEYSETWMTHVGMPAKSGVGGVLLIVVPGVMGIGIISPPLDERGNSAKGIVTAMALSHCMHLGIFDTANK
jgi:glutaminase